MTTPIIVGYRYPDADAAKAVFDRIEKDGRRCSVFRSCTPDRAEWFVLGVFESHDDLKRVDWRDGREVSLDAEQRQWLVGRREQGKLLNAAGVIPPRSVTHHDGGLTMPGGDDPRAGKGRDAEAVATRIAANTNAWLARNLADGGVCDFCCHPTDNDTLCTYVLDRPLVTGLAMLSPEGGAATIYDYQDPYWIACPSCDPVVGAGDASALAGYVYEHRASDRIFRGLTDPGDSDRAEEMERLTELYQRFYDRNPVRHDGAVTGDE